MKSTQTSHGFQAPTSTAPVKATPPGQLLIPRPQLNATLESVYNTTHRTATAHQAAHADSDDEGWGSDFDDVSWTKEEQDYFDARFDWEDRKMAGVEREPPPVPPRSWAK
ncbi:hypothetical protein [Stenotrophomonas sp. PS02289]|uniref:hypothetical protein n=1 Tax=Stenotrophomonas sp. PS02289 TaxID=2991422 RepID=UPI00249B0E50|nr:hypothetical protein [Stenotrophomonas sp. PS02289]